jgi:adenylate kinase
MDVILLGAPGAGKGTQAKVLEEHSGLLHVASGDLFRAALRQGAGLGMLAKSYMDRGELVPDEVVDSYDNGAYWNARLCQRSHF